MLSSLSIKNYALIDQLQVDFNNGLSIITGETGAGKSILLGGLSLILGKRADLGSLRDPSKKCVIEAVFDITHYNLKALFKTEDLDFEPQTIIRREILPSGKSRAFVNDSPVNLSSLQLLAERLVDIHSQNETLQLVDDAFQFQVIDALAQTQLNSSKYKAELKSYKILLKELEQLQQHKADAIKEFDYNSFLLKELEDAKLKEGELEKLEEEYETLNNVEEIQEQLTEANQLLTDENIGILTQLTTLKNKFAKLSQLSSKYVAISERIQSSVIDLDDVFAEIENFESQLEADPDRLSVVNTKLRVLNDLMKKHLASNVSELIDIKNTLAEKVATTQNLEATIAEKEATIKASEKKLDVEALEIYNKRQKAIPELVKQLESILKHLGMSNAQFKIETTFGTNYYYNGKETLSFLFSANKGGQFNSLKKAASGGELSRIMLAIKSVLSKYVKLPTIIFDEIDTGVSGEISNKMADIMLQMSKSMQVISITHLPQIAAKGHTHFKVFKEDIAQVTTTQLLMLTEEERIVEIAQMLGGKELSSSAIAHAKELLN
ncbi:DNA repair protein RecN [Lacinutrix salivirga]